jgi:hypothetical protein
MNFVKIDKKVNIDDEIISGINSAKFKYLISKLRLNQSQISLEYKRYELDFDVFNSQEITMMTIFIKYAYMKLHQMLYHQHQKALHELINISKARSIIDIGFTIIDNYVKIIIKNNPKLRNLNKITLASSNKAELEFTCTLLEFLSPYWRKYVILLEEDVITLSQISLHHDLVILHNLVYDKDFGDQYLQDYLKNTKKTAMFLFSNTVITKNNPGSFDAIESLKSWIQRNNLVLREERIINMHASMYKSDTDLVSTNTQYLSLWHKL